MIAELIAVGSELVHFGQADTNSDWLTERLQRLGFRVGARVAVDDDPGRIAEAVRSARRRARLVLVSGGLGPTLDDRTRAALAGALGTGLERDDAMVQLLRERYARRGFPFSEAQARMAEKPRGTGWLANQVGGAPGIAHETDRVRLYALPGVPAELKAMFEREVVPRVRSLPRQGGLFARTLRIAGRSESAVDEVIADLYEEPDLELTVLARATGIELRLLVSASDPDRAGRRLDALEAEVLARFGEDLVGRDDETLERVVGEALSRAGKSLAVAESCTAGLLAATLTRTPGASAWFRGGVLVYSDALKQSLAGVPAALLVEHGAVSEAVVRALAEGVRQRCDTDLGLGITGIAGPGGGGPDKPVGLVHVALADGSTTVHRELRLVGDRALVRRRAVTSALDLVRRSVR